MVLAALIRSILIHNYEGAAVCLLTLVLFILPSFLEGSLQVEIPGLFQGIIYCFIFAAMILGELHNYYTKIPIWDTALHTLNGFLFAAVGFVTIDLLNRNSKAFCFSMTIGVLWEFIECAGDLFFGQDMQKDFIVQVFQSCKLDPTNNQQAIKVADIIKTQIFTASGQVFEVEGGYLDIGILDTMKDLLVNLIGAVVFCIFGFVYLHFGSKKKLAASVVEGLRIQPAPEEPAEEEEEA